MDDPNLDSTYGAMFIGRECLFGVHPPPKLGDRRIFLSVLFATLYVNIVSSIFMNTRMTAIVQLPRRADRSGIYLL